MSAGEVMPTASRRSIEEQEAWRAYLVEAEQTIVAVLAGDQAGAVLHARAASRAYVGAVLPAGVADAMLELVVTRCAEVGQGALGAPLQCDLRPEHDGDHRDPATGAAWRRERRAESPPPT